MENNLKLREIREAQGLSQRAVAQSLGVTPGAVAKWELGYTQPTLGEPAVAGITAGVLHGHPAGTGKRTDPGLA